MSQVYSFTRKITITGEQIDNIMYTALESNAIAYWCSNVRQHLPKGEVTQWAHEALTHKGKLYLHDSEENKTHVLTLKKFFKGLSMHTNLDFDDFDAEDADIVIQFALFGELVYA